jgi:S-DNA-T family DNA segregation ATPase FtsK/SpoIIIE
LQVALVLEGSGGDGRDIVVDVDPDRSVGALAAALAHHVGDSGSRWTLEFERDPGSVDPDLPVGRLGLVQGNRVTLRLVSAGASGSRPAGSVADATVLTSRTSPTSGFELAMVGGSGAGRRYPMVAGRYVVGRGSEADVVLVGDDGASRKHVAVVVSESGVTIEDLGSTNGTFVDGRRVEGPTRIGPHEVVEAGSSFFTVGPAVVTSEDLSVAVDGWRAFNRPPRVTRPYEPAMFSISDPPGLPRKSRIPMGAAVIPIALGVVMFLVLNQPIFLLFSALGPAMMIWSAVDDRRSGRREFRKSALAFDTDLTRLGDELAGAHRDEIAARRAAAPAAADLVARAETAAPTLWERRPTDRDFLDLRLGLADLPSDLRIQVGESGDAALRERAERLAAAYSVAPVVPVVVSLTDAGVLGVAGSIGRRQSMARSLVAQAATLHSPRDLAIVVLGADGGEPAWEWTKWLPHSAVLLGSSGGGRSVSSGVEDVRSLFESLESVMTARIEQARSRSGRDDQRFQPEILVFIAANVSVPKPALSNLLSDGPAVGIRAVCLANYVPTLTG